MVVADYNNATGMNGLCLNPLNRCTKQFKRRNTMNQEWKNRKNVRPPVGEEVEVAQSTGQGTLIIKTAIYTVEAWHYKDNDGVDCECPLETYEVWREKVTTA
jgi:hypothetical protein